MITYSALLLTWLSQVFARHLRGLRQAEQTEHRRRNVAQRAAREQRATITVNQNNRHRIGRVRGEYLPRHGIDHLLGVTVVGGDDDRTIARLHRRDHAPEVTVENLDGFNGRRELARDRK